MKEKTRRNMIEVDVPDPGVAVLMPEGVKFILVLDDEAKNNRYVFKIDKGQRIDLGMALLSADGAKVDVRLTWPREKKAKVEKPTKGRPRRKSSSNA
jgi:hypothetical protein